MAVPVPDMLSGRPSDEEPEVAGEGGAVCSEASKEVEADEVGV